MLPASSRKRSGEVPATASPHDPPATRRIVRVEPVMGTVVSFDVRLPGGSAELPDPKSIERALDAACRALHDVDARFSLYRPDSELSRLGRGELGESDLSTDARWVLAACDDIARTSGGAFDARGHRDDGVVDPSGFVKGWAVEAAAERLTEAGATDWSIAAG
ncbi:MAG: FAD:protein FMN transferase, partial [Candidatus Limnocylindrales bacterium]